MVNITGTMELGNGETCPFEGCDFILGEDYDGDSFKHIEEKHGDEAMSQLFPVNKIELGDATNIMAMVIQYAKIDKDKGTLTLRSTAIDPLKEVYEFLLNLNNKGASNEKK